jgi:tRNA-binding protein
MANDSDSTPALGPDVAFEVFDSLELRVARVESAKPTEGTRAPSRELVLDLGPLGQRRSVGQYALVPEEELVGRKVIACCNLGTRRMGRYLSEVLVLGTDHPHSPPGQAQALPLWAHPDAVLGDRVY